MSYLRECPFCGNPDVGKIHPTHTFFHMTVYECGQCGAVIHFEDPSAIEGFDPDARFNRRARNTGKLSKKLIDEFNRELVMIARGRCDDPEIGHYEADQLMADTLKDLGFDLQPFEDMDKWYSYCRPMKKCPKCGWRILRDRSTCPICGAYMGGEE